MKKKLMVVSMFLLIVVLFISGCQKKINNEQEVYQKTMDISKQYLSLRYQTDNVLINANTYPNYKTWDTQISRLIKNWKKIEKDATQLENLANKMVTSDLALSFFPKVYAYDKQEISDVFDKALAGKKIATLAKHLWIDAKTAFKILQQDQAQVEADAWNEAGNTFQTLETSAVLIKDTCKVAWFVWSIAVGWGVAVLATKWVLSQAVVVVGGADLVLEVTDDAANIALGNHNKISSLASKTRIVTEPIASILTISDIPNNLKIGFEKFSSTMVVLDQFNSTIQEGKVVGIQLPTYQWNKKTPVKVSILEKEELWKRLKETQSKTIKEVEESDMEALKEITSQGKEDANLQEEKTTTNKKNSEWIVWLREGEVRWKSSSKDPFEYDKRTIHFLENGKAEANMVLSDVPANRKQEWNTIKIYDMEDGIDFAYHEFLLEGNTLTFIKVTGADSEWNDDARLAGSSFFWGTFFEAELSKVK